VGVRISGRWNEAFEGMWALEISFSLCAESVVVLSNTLFAGSLFPLNVLLGPVLFLACCSTPHPYIHSIYVPACDELSVARSQNPEGPATGHPDTGFLGFPGS
jgi:hypothetical protein